MVVYAKAPFSGTDQVLSYLGRSAHKTAITNHRLVDFDGEHVRFRWRDYAHGNKVKVMRLDVGEFIRRFLLHVLPKGFTRIRHYGLLANRCRGAKLARCRELLAQPEPEPPEPETAAAMMLRLTGKDITVCERCGHGPLRQVPLLDRPHFPGNGRQEPLEVRTERGVRAPLSLLFAVRRSGLVAKRHDGGHELVGARHCQRFSPSVGRGHRLLIPPALPDLRHHRRAPVGRRAAVRLVRVARGRDVGPCDDRRPFLLRLPNRYWSRKPSRFNHRVSLQRKPSGDRRAGHRIRCAGRSAGRPAVGICALPGERVKPKGGVKSGAFRFPLSAFRPDSRHHLRRVDFIPMFVPGYQGGGIRRLWTAQWAGVVPPVDLRLLNVEPTL